MVSFAGLSLATAAACCLAGQALSIRLATRRGRTVDVMVVVMAINVVLLVPITLVVVPDPTLTTRGVVAFAAAGITGTILGRLFFYSGIQRVGASRAEPLKASMPLYATILAVVFLGEVVAGLQAAGVLLIVVGIALVSWEGRDRSPGSDGTPVVGLAFPLVGAFFFAVEPILASFGFREGSSALVGLSVKTVVAMVIFTGYVALRDSLPRPADLPVGDRRWFLAAGLFNTAFLVSYYVGVALADVAVIVPIMQASPLVVIAASAVFLGDLERVTPRLVLAASVVVVGALLVSIAG